MADILRKTLPCTLHTVFLDRDGVLNEKMPEGQYVTSWSEFKVLPGAAEAVGRLNRAGLRVVVISNQRGVALGLYTASDVEAIHAEFQRVLRAHGAHIDAFYFCPHDKKECNCRKPLRGLFDEAVAKFPKITAATSVMIGDSLSDIEFGKRLEILSIFIQGDPTTRRSGSDAALELADMHFSSLAEAVDALLMNMPTANPEAI